MPVVAGAGPCRGTCFGLAAVPGLQPPENWKTLRAWVTGVAMLFRIKRIVTCLAAMAVLSLPAVGQEPAEIGPDDWQLTCEPNGCLVLKPVPIDGQGRRVMLTFAVPTDGGVIRMALLTPLGTALEPGLRVQIGTQEQSYRFSTCMTDGCAVVVELTDDDIANMAVQPSMLVEFNAVNRAEPYVVTVPMADLGEAIALARKGGAE